MLTVSEADAAAAASISPAVITDSDACSVAMATNEGEAQSPSPPSNDTIAGGAGNASLQVRLKAGSNNFLIVNFSKINSKIRQNICKNV